MDPGDGNAWAFNYSMELPEGVAMGPAALPEEDFPALEASLKPRPCHECR